MQYEENTVVSEDLQLHPSLLNDSSSMQTLKHLYFTENGKEEKGLSPAHMTILTYLVLRKCEDHEITDSLATIGARTACSVDTVRRVLKDLRKWNWLSTRARHATSNAIQLNIEEFPAEQSVREAISPEARELAKIYTAELLKLGVKRLPKNFIINNEAAAQHLITRYQGDFTKIGAFLTYAVRQSQYRVKDKTDKWKNPTGSKTWITLHTLAVARYHPIVRDAAKRGIEL